MMTEETEKKAASKGATVKMHKKAMVASKKKPDLEGIRLLEDGVKAGDERLRRRAASVRTSV